MTNNIGLSSHTSPRRQCSGKGVEITALSDAHNASIINHSPSFVSTESKDGLDNFLYCRMCLMQSHEASKYPFFETQWYTELNQNRKKNLKTLSRRKALSYRPRYGRSSPPSPKNRSWHRQRNRQELHTTAVSMKGQRMHRDPVHQPKIRSGRGPGGSLRRCEQPLTRRIVEDLRRRCKG